MVAKEKKEGLNIQSVDRALSILEVLCHSPEPLSVKELSDYTQLKRTTVSGLISTLQKRNYVLKDDISGKYIPSIKLLYLSFDYPLKRTNIKSVIDEWPSVISMLPTGKLDCTIGLYADGEHILTVVFSSKQESGYLYAVMPLQASGVGKCTMAFSPELQTEEFLDKLTFKAYTNKTIMGKEALLRDLGEIQKRGYAEDNGEYLENTYCCAFPVFNRKKQLVAAVSVTGTKEEMQEHKGAVIRCGLQVSKMCSMSLGWAP